MAEQFLTLMADLDGAAQARLQTWYQALGAAGFTGTQTPGLPYHVSLATFPLDEEETALRIMKETAANFPPLPVYISHAGIFAPGRVLFAAPEGSAGLSALHAACEIHPHPQHPRWTPHITLLIDEAEAVCAAVPVLMKAFSPFQGTLTRLHLCAFWPAREIGAAPLAGK